MLKTFSMVTSTIFVVALTACGGGADSSDSSNDNNGNNNTAPTQTEATSICTGTGTNTSYDVFLPTASGLTLATRAATSYGSGNNQCVTIAASTAQADTSAIQMVTKDNWANLISYFDPIGGSAVAGGTKLDQALVVTCNSANDIIRHLAVLSTSNGTPTRVTSNQIATVLKNTGFMSYECMMTGNSVSAGRGNSNMTFSSLDGSITVADSTASPTVFASADALSLFTNTGLNKDGNIMHGYLYQIPNGTSSKQVVVITNRKANGTFGLVSFYQP